MQNKIWVNGSFDVMHIGHVKLLSFANELGSVRVGLDSDERIKRRKGIKRPVNKLQDRFDFISAIKFVDSVVTFDSDEELISLIREFAPDIVVIGEEYEMKDIVGFKYMPKVIYFPKFNDISTTQILRNA